MGNENSHYLASLLNLEISCVILVTALKKSNHSRLEEEQGWLPYIESRDPPFPLKKDLEGDKIKIHTAGKAVTG